MAVTVQYAIVHITNVNDPAPDCSEIDLDLGANPVLRDYFTGQVQHALDDESTGAAVFAATGPQETRDACNGILTKQADFVSRSQELARLLHAAMKTHPRIAPGSLAVCVYTANSNEARHLALIKLDPGSVLVLKPGTRNGKKLYTFDVQKNVMPTAREKLQKAALLSPAGSATYDLLLLDRQTLQVATAWWAGTFLNATLIVDGKSGATDFNRANQSAYLRLMKDGRTVEADEVKERARMALGGKSVRISAYVKSLPKDARDIVEAELGKKFPATKTIPIDPEFSAKLTKKTRFRGEWGVIVEYDTEHEKEIVQEKTPIAGGFTRLVLHVPDMKQVK